MLVYVVTVGEYSDYGIVKIFSTRERAEEYIALCNKYDKYNANFNEIEDYEIDPDVRITHNHPFKFFYDVDMDKDGNIRKISKPYLDIDDIDSMKQKFYFSEGIDWDTDDINYRKYLCFHGQVNANDEEHAIKIMGEKRSKLLREGRWITTLDEMNEKGMNCKAIDV